jgi:hypothetical protein
MRVRPLYFIAAAEFADVFSVVSFLVFVFFSTTTTFSFHFVSRPNFSFLPVNVLFSHFFAFFLYSFFLFSLPSLHFSFSFLHAFFFYYLFFCSVPPTLTSSFFSLSSYWSHFFFSSIHLFLQFLTVILPLPLSLNLL